MKTSFETFSYIPLYQEKWEKNFIYLLVNDLDDQLDDMFLLVDYVFCLDTILPKAVHESMEISILQNSWVLDLSLEKPPYLPRSNMTVENRVDLGC